MTTTWSDRDALAALFRATGGKNWHNNDNWDTDAELASWRGVEVDSKGRVVKIDLTVNNLRGVVPPELRNLPALQNLNLWGNELSGAIPPELGNLTALQLLNLSNNKLRGAIPPELGNLPALQQLYLLNNKLSGAIPPELGNLTALQQLHFSNNKLSGAIPPELRNLTVLRQLYLSENDLSGAIPPELGNLPALQLLNLWSNKLSGAIPPELRNLTVLRQLLLSENDLSGAIPPELGNLTALQLLNLSNNKLSGAIPPGLGNFTALQSLRLSNNKLSGAIPPELGNLPALQLLNLCGNDLSGAIPPELGNLTALQRLNLWTNKLSGAIPPELGNLTALQLLNLSNNKLRGAIPPELGNIPALQRLDLSGNKLSGTIPEELGKLTALRWLDLSDNELTGMGTGDHAANVLPMLLVKGCKLYNNPWELPPAAVVAVGDSSIRGYYNELQLHKRATEPEEFHSLKVVFAGHSGAGKTSLIKTILAGRGKLAEGNEIETVGVEVSDYNLAGKSTKFYDLAGQVDYYGLHQLFMTERAVYVMTWDASKYLRRKEELVEELMGWLSALHLRAPRSTVILVGTHSDKIAGGWCSKWLRRLGIAPSLSSIMVDVEKALEINHEAWKAKRGISTDSSLTVEGGIVLVSSSPGPLNDGVSNLLTRLENQKGSTSFIPPSWSLGLLLLDALRYGVEPLEALRCWEEGRPLPATSAAKKTWVQRKIVAEAWQEVQDGLPDDRKAGDPSFAMESALNLREFGGSLLQHEEIVFLDVEDLALRLAPVLNHKTWEHDKDDGHPMFGGKRLEKQWQLEASRRLIQQGILHRCFAGFLWETPGQPFPEATFDVLVKLGILLPLSSIEHLWWEAENRTGDHICGRTDAPRVNTACGRGYLVLMRLPNEPSGVIAGRLKAFTGLRRQWGLASKWEFHKGAAPHGLVERIIASCHIIGNLVGGTCWRKGACFVGNDAGRRAGGGSYALMVDFCEETGSENIPTAGTLTIRAFGARDGRTVWGAMRFAISTVCRLFGEFPGLSWRGWLECPADEGVESHTLPGPRERRLPGDLIVSPHSRVSCPCSVAAGVRDSLGAVLSPYASMDQVFQAPAENDGGAGTIVEGASEFSAALDEVLRVVGRRDAEESGAPSMKQGSVERAMDIAKHGCVQAALVLRDGFVGAALFVAEFGEQIVEAADRWNDLDDGGLGNVIPITLIALVLLVWVSAYLSRILVWRLGRCRRWWSPPTHRD